MLREPVPQAKFFHIARHSHHAQHFDRRRSACWRLIENSPEVGPERFGWPQFAAELIVNRVDATRRQGNSSINDIAADEPAVVGTYAFPKAAPLPVPVASKPVSLAVRARARGGCRRG